MDVLVSTDWVKDNLENPKVRIAEVDVDTAAYDQGHVPGAVGWNWTTQLCDTLVRDVIPKDKLEACSVRQASTTTRPWSCTGTTTTGSPHGLSGSSSSTAIRMCASWTAAERSGSRKAES
jgi:hypothetical protein